MNAYIRVALLFALVAALIILLVFSFIRRKSDATWNSFYSNFMPGLVLSALVLFPETCHEQEKPAIKVAVCAAGLLGGILWMSSTGSLSPMALIAGSILAGAQWVFTALLCTDICRSMVVRKCKDLKVPNVFWWFMDDGKDEDGPRNPIVDGEAELLIPQQQGGTAV